jgi:CheY-like chemotaxis protein
MLVPGLSAGDTTCSMMEPRVFVLEDDPQMRSLLVRGLREEGYEVQGFATGSDLLRKVAETVPELFVIDIGLPDTDGRDVCQALRAQGITALVLFLTARDWLSCWRRRLPQQAVCLCRAAGAHRSAHAPQWDRAQRRSGRTHA